MLTIPRRRPSKTEELEPVEMHGPHWRVGEGRWPVGEPALRAVAEIVDKLGDSPNLSLRLTHNANGHLYFSDERGKKDNEHTIGRVLIKSVILRENALRSGLVSTAHTLVERAMLTDPEGFIKQELELTSELFDLPVPDFEPTKAWQ